MFRDNQKHSQKTMFGLFDNMPESISKYIKKGWPKPFYENIFCYIPEEKFAILYSDKYSRPNSPINKLVSFDIIKEAFNFTDEEMMAEYKTNLSVFYAVGASSIADQDDLSLRTVYNFRKRVLEYEKKTGVSLLEEVNKDITDKLVEIFDIKLDKQRMDSKFISANIKNLTRLNLFEEVLRRFLKDVYEEEVEELSEEDKRLREGKQRDISYRTKPTDVEKVLKDYGERIVKLYHQFQDDERYQELESFNHMKRIIEEQLIIKEEGKIEIKNGK